MPASCSTAPAREDTWTTTVPCGTPHSSRGAVGSARGPSGGVRSRFALSVIGSLSRSGRWEEWSAAEPRLAGFASLEDALEGWQRRDKRCYQVVAGLTSLGSRRGGDDDDAAL